MPVTATSLPELPLPPAPGADRHPSLELANSAVVLPGPRPVDLLSTAGAATRWLVDRGLAGDGTPLQEHCATRLTALRGHVRELFRSVVEGVAPREEDLLALNAALTLTPTAALLEWDPTLGLHRSTMHPTTQVVEHAITALATDAAELLSGPDAERLAACQAPPCNRYLLRTHARRHWCSTRCGDRVRAARAYARRTTMTSERAGAPAG